MMMLKVLFLTCLVCSIWANEDLVRDVIADTINGDLVERRALVNAVGSASVVSAAKAFANSLGSKASLGGRMSQSFEDSCLGSSNPSFPTFSKGLPTKIDWNKIVGKRAEGKLANRDIVFVLDTSGSIPQDQFDKAKKAITTLVESFCPSKFGSSITAEGNKQVAVVLFDSTQTTEIDFSDSARGLGYLQDKILDMNHRKGGTATSNALMYVRERVLGKGSSRLNNNQVSTDVIVITDGQCNSNCRILGAEADKIRKMGVNLFAMGVAKARACELEIITGSGSNLAYGLGDFRNFDRFATAVKEIAQESDSKCA